MKTLIAVVVILILLLGGIFFARNFFPFAKNSTSAITYKGKTYTVLVARTDKEREIGLSGRDGLPNGVSGMVFPFEKADYWPFWMRNMKFPLDIIYIRDKKVVTIFSNIPNPPAGTQNPPILKPAQPVDTVLELKAGEAQTLGIKEGDSIIVSL